MVLSAPSPTLRLVIKMKIIYNQKTLQKYEDRYTRWADITLSQLSFYNNLLLTLGVAFLSFAYQDLKPLNLECSIKNIDWPLTLYVFSFIVVMLSIFTGSMASMSRLYDFRITSHVNLIRRRVFEHSNIKLNGKTPEKFSFWKNLYLPYKLFCKDYTKITLEQCEDWEKNKNKLDASFVELRTLSHNLGLGTWCRIRWQTFSFLLAIIFYAASILFS